MYILILLVVLVIVLYYLFRTRNEGFDIPNDSFEQLKNTIAQQFAGPENNLANQIIMNLETSKKESLANRLKKFKELNIQYLDEVASEALYFELRMNSDENIRKQLVKGIFIYKSILANNPTTPEYSKFILNMIIDFAKNNKFTKSKYEYMV